MHQNAGLTENSESGTGSTTNPTPYDYSWEETHAKPCSRLLASFEDATTTEGILDWFAPGGVMVLGDQGAAGDEILQARGAILPADGSVQWNVRATNLLFHLSNLSELSD